MNRKRFLTKNKQSFIALFVLLAMAFNACSNPAGSEPVELTTPEYGYVDSNGNITETDSGRTVVVADKNAKAVFYSDNLASDAQRVGFAYGGKTMIFFFEKDQNFPTSIVMSGSGEPVNGIFSPYDSATQTYSLTVEQGGDQATLTDIALKKDILTQYKDDPGFSPSQNLRMRNLYIAMQIYKSLDAFLASDNAHQAKGIWNGVNKLLQVFIPGPVTEIVTGAMAMAFGANSLMSSNPLTMVSGMSSLKQGATLVTNGINNLVSDIFFVPVTGITVVPTTAWSGNYALSGTVSPANATNKIIVWSIKSSDSVSASIKGNTLTIGGGIMTGNVIVTATIANGKAKGTPYTQNFPIAITNPNPFVAVTGITDVPTTAPVGSLTLSGTVVPNNATNKTIVWSVKSPGDTGAKISGDTLTTKKAGTVTVTATIANGKGALSPYTKDFSITIGNPNTFVAVTRITDVPTTASMGSLTLSGEVEPYNATNDTIVWSVKSPGTTGARISGDNLTTTAAGTVIVTATIADGKAAGTPYTQDFIITVTNANNFIAVTGITGISTTASVGSLTLSGTVSPYNATNKTIVWSVKSPGTTGAKISGATLITTAAGTVTVTGTIANGKTVGTPFTQDFTITVTASGNTGGTGGTGSSGGNEDGYENGFYWVKNKNGVTITGYNGPGGNVTIPSVIDGKQVTSIGNRAFRYDTSITSVTIPNGVISIEDGGSRKDAYGQSVELGAFLRCTNLTSVTIPDSVTTIGAWAFLDCFSLTSVTIPSGVTSIRERTFDQCINLTRVTIPNSVTSIGEMAFSYCSNLTSIIIPDGVTSIGGGAFLNCPNLREITIPDGVTSIEKLTFASCTSITRITIPAAVTSIGESAFSACSLTSITIPSGVTSIGRYAFSYCDSLTSVTFLCMVSSISNSFDGNLYELYPVGGIGTYTRLSGSKTWTKQ